MQTWAVVAMCMSRLPKHSLIDLSRPSILHFCMQAWAVVAMCTASMSSPASFYVLRLLLGVTEAGAFPGMWYVCGQVSG